MGVAEVGATVQYWDVEFAVRGATYRNKSFVLRVAAIGDHERDGEIDRRIWSVDDPFAVKELRIRQPAKLLPGRARYDIFDSARNLLAVASETDARSVLHTMASLVPNTRVLAVRSPLGEPMFRLVKRDSDWLTDVTDADGALVGRIRTEDTRRHFTLLNPGDEVLGEASGDLAVKQFVIAGPEGERYGRLQKTWAGLGKELLTSSDHYTITFTGPVPRPTRTLIVMVPIILDMTRHGPY
jgi:hypothetical protein